MFCVKCGNQINDEAKFCPKCGASQEDVAEPVAPQPEVTAQDGFDFHQWIVQNGLDSYETYLKNQDLDTLDVLMTLTETDLDKIGIESIGAKKKILNGIQNLRTSASAYTATKEMGGRESIPNRCPNCGEVWGLATEKSGAGNTLGKALVGAFARPARGDWRRGVRQQKHGLCLQ